METKFTFAVLLMLSVALAACGGGGAGNTAPTTPTSDGTTPSTAEPTSAESSNSSVTTANSAPTTSQTCVQTVDGCATKTDYEQSVKALERSYASQSGFRNQPALNTINANSAWAKIQLKYGTGVNPGSGVTVGLIDSGIDTRHPMFAGKTVFEHHFSGTPEETGETESSHGTAVASIIAASPRASTIAQGGSRGVAWGAEIAMFAVPTSSGGGDYDPIDLPEIRSTDATWAARVNYVANWRNRTLDFVNISLGFQGIIDQYSASSLRNNFRNTINALAQSGSSNKTVFIWSAGNGYGRDCDVADFSGSSNICVNGKVNAKSPQVLAGLPARIPELRANNVAVVAVDQSGDIASFSNRCGIAANWCIAAPGVGINAAYFGPKDGDPIKGLATYSGTSIAAPMVTGGLALMKHLFRSQLSNTALVSRLYATANKSGRYANSLVYGQGLLDLDAATSPVEFTNIQTGSQVGSTGFSLQRSNLNLGTAFGDAIGDSLAGQEIVAFDALGAPFWYDFQHLTPTDSGPSLSQRLNSFMNSIHYHNPSGVSQPTLAALPDNSVVRNSAKTNLSFIDGPGLTDEGGHLSLAGGALMMNRAVSDQFEFGYFTSEPVRLNSPVSGMEIVFHNSSLPFTLRSGLVSEQETLLGSSGSGAFGSMAGRSAFFGVEKDTRIGAWLVGAGAQIGTLNPKTKGESIFAVTSPLTTSAIAIRTQRNLNRNDQVTMSLSQPIRVESGRAYYSIPVGRTIDGKVLQNNGYADLEPSGRQIDLAAQWHHQFRPSSEFRLATQLSLQPGHSSSAHPELALMAGWRTQF